MQLPDHPRIDTERLTIRRLARDDLPDLLAVNGDDEVTRYLPYPRWASPADGEAWFDRMTGQESAGAARQFVIEHRELGRVIGSCLLFRFDLPSERAELGYVLGREHWGRGLMLEAMRGFVGYAFDGAGVRRLEAEIDPRNRASARLLERLGFVHEGLLRQRWVTKGQASDSALYGLLRGEAAA
jgi:RimJ/RimL family protein N-acetyltransferase